VIKLTEEEFKKNAKTIPINIEKEEKAAIDYFKYKVLPTTSSIGFESKEEHYTKVILNLIEKLQKENEELRVQGSIILLDYNILKDKIREKIETLKKEATDRLNEGRENIFVTKRLIIDILEELLEEE
jgi:hypothetical protein